MVVLTDNVVVFCTQDKQRFRTEQNKKATRRWLLMYHLHINSDYKSRFSFTPARIQRPGCVIFPIS